MAKEIPGFYFDEEKQKYFKIQPNHVAPKGSRYAKDAISIEKEASLVGASNCLFFVEYMQRLRWEYKSFHVAKRY